MFLLGLRPSSPERGGVPDESGAEGYFLRDYQDLIYSETCSYKVLSQFGESVLNRVVRHGVHPCSLAQGRR